MRAGAVCARVVCAGAVHAGPVRAGAVRAGADPLRCGEDVADRQWPRGGRTDDLGRPEPCREVGPDAAHGQVVLPRAQGVSAVRDRLAEPVERTADRFRPQVGEDGPEGTRAPDHGCGAQPQAAGAGPVEDEAPVGVPPDVQAGTPQHGAVGVGQGEDPALRAEGDPVPVEGVVVPVGGVELVVHPQGEGRAGEHAVQGAERLRPDVGGQGRRVREAPGPQRAHRPSEDVHQGVHQVDRGGGVHEERPLPCREPAGRVDEVADRGDVRVVGVEAVLHSPAARVSEVVRQFGEVDGVFLEDVDAPVHECPGQLGAPAAGDGRADGHAGRVDVGRESVGVRVVGDADPLRVGPGGGRSPAEDAGQCVAGAPACRLGVEAAEVGAADQHPEGRRCVHSTPSSTWSASAAAPVGRRSATPRARRCRTTVSGSSTSQAKCTPAGTSARSTAATASAPTVAVSR